MRKKKEKFICPVIKYIRPVLTREQQEDIEDMIDGDIEDIFYDNNHINEYRGATQYNDFSGFTIYK